MKIKNKCLSIALITIFSLISFIGCSGSGGGGGSKYNYAPIVNISAPDNYKCFFKGQAVNFSCSSFDKEQGSLSGNALVWESNVNGQIGTGEAISPAAMSFGRHLITLTGTDDAGRTCYDSIIVYVFTTAPVGSLITWYKDSDEDGYTDGTTTSATSKPAGFCHKSELYSMAIDFNDNDASCYPNADENCSDDKDNDGNGQTDCSDDTCTGSSSCSNDDSVFTWYKDADGDGYTDGTTTFSVTRPANYCQKNDLHSMLIDFNDNDATCYPSALENCSDNKDNDGDGQIDCDDNECNGASGCSSDVGPVVWEVDYQVGAYAEWRSYNTSNPSNTWTTRWQIVSERIIDGLTYYRCRFTNFQDTPVMYNYARISDTSFHWSYDTSPGVNERLMFQTGKVGDTWPMAEGDNSNTVEIEAVNYEVVAPSGTYPTYLFAYRQNGQLTSKIACAQNVGAVKFWYYDTVSGNITRIMELTKYNSLPTLNSDDDGDGYTENQGDSDDGDNTVYPGAVENCIDNKDNDQDGYIDLDDSDCGSYISTFTLPDTGQARSFTDTFGEDSDYTRNPQSFTKLDGEGNALADTATQWSMVKDNNTGLIWEIKTDANKDDTYSLQNAKAIFIAGLNSRNFGGYSDWRLPTIRELMYIADRNRYLPTINTDYFSDLLNNTSWAFYWASTKYVDSTFSGWALAFGNGYTDSRSKDTLCYVRAVRGGQPDSEFIINNDGTVTDTTTNLMWQQVEADSTMNWEEAIQYCEALNLAGHSDWRLPNVNELYSLLDFDHMYPVIDSDIFIGSDQYEDSLLSGYWSSTSSNSSYPWIVYFSIGQVYAGRAKTMDFKVRAVRSINE